MQELNKVAYNTILQLKQDLYSLKKNNIKLNIIDTVSIAGIYNRHDPLNALKFRRRQNNKDVHYGMEFYIWQMLLIIKSSSLLLEYCEPPFINK